MATSMTKAGPFILVNFAATHGDFDLTNFFPEKPELLTSGIPVRSITMVPTAANDIMKVRNTAAANQTSPLIMDEKATADTSRPKTDFGSEGQLMLPAVDASDVTVGVQMIIELSRHL